MHIYIYIYIKTHTCMHTYIYMHTYIHTHTHTFAKSAGAVEYTDCPNECSIHDTKQSDGEVPVMLEL